MKSKISSIGNTEKYFRIVFIKEQSVLTVLEKMLYRNESDPVHQSTLGYMLTGKSENNYGDSILHKKQNIKNIKDAQYDFSEENHNFNQDIHIIFGDKRVFLIAYISDKTQEKFRSIVSKECIFITPKKIKKSKKQKSYHSNNMITHTKK